MNLTVSHSQHEILGSISEMYLKGERLHLDTCYNRGGFYKHPSSRLQEPELKNDLNQPAEGVSRHDVRALPYSRGSIRSVIFDPPFLVGDSHLGRRYGSFPSPAALFDFHRDALQEISRVLQGGGWLITKIQDFTEGRQKYFPSIYQVIKAREFGLYLIDSFVLVTKNKMRDKRAGRLMAASVHCFFHVFQKERRRKRIIRY